MRSGDEYNGSSPRDAESTAGMYFAEEEVHKDFKIQLSVTSFSEISKASEQTSRTREGPQDNIIDPVNHRGELFLFGRHIELLPFDHPLVVEQREEKKQEVTRRAVGGDRKLPPSGCEGVPLEPYR